MGSQLEGTAQPVTLVIVSHSLDHSEMEQHRAEGKLYVKADSCYIQYEEKQEQYSEPVRNTLKFDGRECIVIRNGPIRMRHTYRPGTTTQSSFRTPHMDMRMETETEFIRLQVAQAEPNVTDGPVRFVDVRDVTALKTLPKTGKFSLKYSLKLNEAEVGLFELRISFAAR